MGSDIGVRQGGRTGWGGDWHLSDRTAFTPPLMIITAHLHYFRGL